MRETTAQSIPVFLFRVMIIHTVTYLIAGMAASSIFDYKSVFELPVIRDYMVEFGTASIFWGPFIQPVRGLIIGLVLLPFRGFLANTVSGWFYLWLIFVGIGILSTPAAAPCSIEGIIYTKLPLWYHLFGLPEILAQTLVFSVLVHLYLRHPKGIVEALPPIFGILLQSIAGAAFAFIGYAIVSILFALSLNADINAEANMSLRIQGMFLAPLIFNAALIAFFNIYSQGRRDRPVAVFGLIWLCNAVLIAGYQQFVLDGVNVVYAVIAPILPAVIIAAIVSKIVSKPNYY